MIEKTKGIVLHTIKHTESGVISHIFTEKYGRLSLMARGIHNKKGSSRSVYFQPLQMVDIEMYYKENRDIHSIKELSSSYIFEQLPFDIKRNSIALFIAEILYRSLPEKEKDVALFNYIAESIIYLDRSKGNISNFHLGFMVGFARFLGIAPSSVGSTGINYFDMQNGNFSKTPPIHGFYFDTDQTEIFYLFMKSSIEECEQIKLSGKIRTRFLNNLINFFSLHLPGIKNIKSLDILANLYS